jgi:hypothetical protein
VFDSSYTKKQPLVWKVSAEQQPVSPLVHSTARSRAPHPITGTFLGWQCPGSSLLGVYAA